MKRILTVVGILILVLLLTAAVLIGSAFIGRQAITDGAEINGIRIVKDGIVGIAVVPINANEVALIDAGNDPSGKAILAELSRRGLGPEAVTAILLTHGHADARRQRQSTFIRESPGDGAGAGTSPWWKVQPAPVDRSRA